MKKHYIPLMLAFLFALTSFAQTPIITNVVDGSCGNTSKFVELYVSGTVDFADYKLVRRSNAGTWAADGFDIDMSALGTKTDEFVYIIRDLPTLNAEFPSASIIAGNSIVDGGISHNGDDSYRIVQIAGDVVIDQFGGDDDGTGMPWEYTDSWGSRNSGVAPNPTFTISEWTFNGVNTLDPFGVCNGATPLEDTVTSIGAYSPPATVTGPTASAPVPSEDPADVVSIFSDTYTDLAIGNYDPNWGQSGHTLVNTMYDPTGAGTDFVLAYPNFNYQGTDFGFNQDLSGMDFLHVDIWVEAGTDRLVKVSPISNGAGPVEVLVEVPLTPGSWNSVTLDKADFAGMGWESIYQLKFDGQFNGDGSANTTPFDIYLDNIYFSKAPPSTTPTASAPVPTEDPADVVSIYSDTYTDLAIANYDPNWGQSGHMQVNTTFDPTGAGTDFALAYPNFNYQGTDFGSNEDLSDMDFLHVDIWVQAGTDRMVKVSPISNGAGPVEVLVEVPLTPGSWNSVTLDKADFAGMGWESIYQLKFDGQFNGDGSANTTPFDIYLDNIYFSKTPPPPVTAPTVSAPVPGEDPANVVSIYSDTYTDLAIANYDPNWGQSGHMQVNTTFDPTGAGTDFALAYPNFNYQGTDFGSNEDLSDMDFLHVDIWVQAGTDRMVKVSPISNGAGPVEVLVEVPLTPGSWNSVTLDKADFAGMGWESIYQLKFDGQFNGDGSANTTPFDIYLDNIYFSQDPPTGPANDDCDDAIALTVNADSSCTVVTSGTNVGSTPSAQGDDVTGSPDNDVWFSLVATSESHDISLSNIQAVVGSSVDMGMGLYDGVSGCSSLTLVDDSDPNSFTANGLTIGNTYYLRVYGWYNTSSSSYSETTFDVCVGTPPPPPTNDDCSGALPLTVTTDNTTLTSFSTDFATEGPNELNDCDAFGNLGVWYTFTAPATDLVFDQGPNGDPGITIYEGPDCNNLTELTGNCLNNNPGSITGLTVGNTYYAMAWTDSAQTSADFVLYFIDCQPPSALTANNVTTTSADLTWTAGDAETEWEVLWGPTGFDPATEGTLVNDNDGTLGVNLSGLTEATTYDFYVTAVCGAGSTSPRVGPLTFTTACATFTAPFSEDFSSLDLPNCWVQGAANAESWLFTDTPIGHIGNAGSFSNASASGGGFAWVDDSSGHNIDTRLESPFIDVSGLTVPALSFYYVSNNEGDANGNVDFRVEVWDGAAWNQVFFSNQDSPNGEWAEVIVDISTLTITGNIQLAFIVDENNGTGFDDDLAIDDVSVDEAPACLKPVNLTASNIDLTTADISWDPVTNATDGYLWSLFAAGDDPLAVMPLDSGSTDSSTTSVSLSGLSASTDYEFYVESDCDTDGTSGLSAPLGFSTLTPGLDCGVPLSATVTAYGDTSQPISFDTTTVPDMSSVPSCEGTDSTEQGFWYEFTTNATAGVTLSLLAGDAGDIEGAVYDACGGTELFCFADGNSQDFTSEVLVTGLASSTTYILQVYTESFNDGVFDLAITDLPACQQPQNLSTSGVTFDSAQLNWDEEPNAASGYLWEVYTSPSDVTTDTPVDSGTVAFGTNFATVTGLMAETDYDFYVIADCDADGTSVQSGPVTFTTGCVPFTPDYAEDFAGMTFSLAPNCWSEAQNGDPTTGPTDLGSGEWTSDGFLNSGSTGSARINLWNLGTSDWLISPSFDLSADGYEVVFDIGRTAFSGTGDVAMGSDDEVQFLYSEDGGLTWINLITWNAANQPSNAGEVSVTDLSGITGTGVQFAFWGTEGTVDDTEDFNIYVDNFEVRSIPPPANDNLCDAIPLTVGAPTTPDAYSNVAATAEPNEPVPGCFSDGINGSVWFTFVAPASGDVTVTTDIAGSTSDDTEIAVYDAPTDCTDLTTLGTDLGCDQDSGTVVNFNSILSLSALTPGNTYYVQVDIWSFTGNTNLAFGEFGIRVLDNNPPCPEPTNLSVTNVTSDSATLNWDDVTNATLGFEWSVYTSPSDPSADTAVDSGTTVAGMTMADVLGLMAETTYDFYVSSNCDTNGESILSGPVAFTTNPALVTIDCSTGTPVNTTVCYDNDEDLQYTFVSNDGTPLRVSFIEGYIEDCCDDIIIYDGLTTSDPILFQIDGDDIGDDATGIEATSTGDSILVQIVSDVSFSCSDDLGGDLSLSFNVSCVSTDELDYYNLQFPPMGNITLGDQFDVFAQAYEAGLTDASDTPAAGIESWIGYSTTDSSPDTAADWTWVAATPNAGFDFTQNNDEYSLNLGAEIGADGTYYYASRWRLNGGPFTYGGILPDGSNGGEWGTGGFVSGVLTVNNPPPPANDDISGAISVNVDESFCDGTNTNATNEWATGGAEAPGTCFNGANADNDVWFTFVGPANTTFVNVSTDFTGGTLVDTEMSVYSGTPGNLVELACSQDEGVTVLSNGFSWNSLITDLEVTPGETYYVQVAGYGTDDTGTFCLDISTACTTDAGTLTADADPVALIGGTATISATEDTAPNVPAGYSTLYVLTSGAGLVIEQTNASPTFDVTAAGDYTIHTLVYNPATLDLSIVTPGVTTGFDVNALLIQGGGSICASLDVVGAPITVNSAAAVQIIHNSADPIAEFVDIYVDGVLELANVQFRTASPFIAVPSGAPVDIDVALAGSTGVGDSIYNFNTTFVDGVSYILVADGVADPALFDTSVNSNIAFGFELISGVVQTSLNPGDTSILVHHGSTDAPTVDVVETSVPLGTVADDISYTDFTTYATVPTADYVLNVELADNSAVVASYEANLATLGTSDLAITVLASGFLNPAANQNGPAFGLWAALPTGGALIELPFIEPAPMTPAPDPTEDPLNVISMFSGVYTDVPVDTWLTGWSSAQLADIQIQGNDTKLYTNLDFAGIETVANPIDASGMDFFHIDVWSPNATTFRVKLVDFSTGGPIEGEIAFNIPQQQWVSLQIPLVDFADPALVTNPANLLTSTTSIQQLIISGLPVGAVTAYVDNVYFSSTTVGTTQFDSNNFNFYPNPARNEINLETSSQVEQVRIYNMLGQQVMVETPNTVSPRLNVETLQTGTYIMNVTIDGASKNFKFVKE